MGEGEGKDDLAGPRGTDAILGGAPAAPFSGQGQLHPAASVGSAVECRILFPRASSQPLNGEILPRTLTIGPSPENLPARG